MGLMETVVLRVLSLIGGTVTAFWLLIGTMFFLIALAIWILYQ